MPDKPHISVCICTYKRPELLKELLDKLEGQETADLFTYSVVVVDNDRAASACTVAEAFKERGKVSIHYDIQPEQNISLTRNRAVANAQGDFIAFIDDDEFPSQYWLLNLFKIFDKSQVTCVLGPVIPYFQFSPPSWIVNGKFFERKRYPTGQFLHWKETRTANVFFEKAALKRMGVRFDALLGQTGGEDTKFFKELASNGCHFIWCDEAETYEHIPPERCRLSWLLKRAFRTGGLSSKIREKGQSFFFRMKILVNSLLIFIFFSLLFPISFLGGMHYAAKVLMKLAWCSGEIFGLCGFILKEYMG